MKMISVKTFVFSLALTVGITSARAQESQTLQFMKGMPQSNFQNPALHNDSSTVVVGLPGLSGMYVDVNSGFAIQDLMHKGTGVLADSLVLDIENFPLSLKTTNTVEQNSSIPLFYLGIRNKGSFISLGITEKLTGRFSFPKSLVQFIKDGNAPYVGENYDLGNLDLNAIHYREFALGYSSELINGKLTVGAKAKFLYGKSAMQTQRMNLKVETAADGTSINLHSDMKINLSAPVTVEYDAQNYFDGLNDEETEAKDYMLQNGNPGMAFDLGAVYRLTPKLILSASIIDLGKISFKDQVTTLDYAYTYPWEGIDVSNSIDEAQENYVDPGDLFDNEYEKMEESFKPQKSDFGTEAFDMNLPTKVYLGGTYELSPKFNLGLLNRYYKHGHFSQNTVTVSGNAMLSDFLSLTGSYSVIGNSVSNLGFGMGVRMGFLQLYAVGDNLLALAHPARVQYANARFGVNFLFGRKKHSTPQVSEAVVQ